MARSKKRPQPPADIYARIRAVLPHARTAIAHGIDPDYGDSLDEQYAAAAGHELPAILGDDLDTAVAYADAVFVLGMAVGLLLDQRVLELPHQGPRVTR